MKNSIKLYLIIFYEITIYYNHNTNYPYYILSKLWNNGRFVHDAFWNYVYFIPDLCLLKHNLGFLLWLQTICKIRSFLLKLCLFYLKREFHCECLIFHPKFFCDVGHCLAPRQHISSCLHQSRSLPQTFRQAAQRTLQFVFQTTETFLRFRCLSAYSWKQPWSTYSHHLRNTHRHGKLQSS